MSPRDAAAHARVGRLELAAGNRGAALERLDAAVRNGAGTERDRALLGQLLAERIEARIAENDPGTAGDIARFERLCPAAFARWRASESGQRAQGRAADLRRALALRAPGEVDVPGAAGPDELASLAAFALEHGARRAAFELLTEYLRRGGRQVEYLDRWAELVAWRQGNDIGTLWTELSVAREAGAFLCPAARHDGELGCDRWLAPAAEDAHKSRALWRHARRGHWHTADATNAAAWIALALRAWSGGEEVSWEEAMRARLRLEAIDPQAVPAFARATVWRLLGRSDEAAQALRRGLAAARSAGSNAVPAAASAVLVAEAAAQGWPVADVEDLASRLAVPPYGWLAPLAVARAEGDAAAVERIAGRAGVGVLRPLALERLQLPRDGALLSSTGTAPEAGAAVDLLELSPPSTRPLALERLVRGYRRDPALADRRAREWVSQTPWAADRKRALVREFWHLGDSARARHWADSWLEDSPDDRRALWWSAVAAAADGDIDAAEVLTLEAAAVSGDPGRWLLAGARVFVRVGRPLEGIGLVRRALDQLPPGRRGAALALLADAQRALGRNEQAAAAERHRVDDIRPRYRDRVVEPPAGGDDAASPMQGTLVDLDRRIAWRPLSIDLRIGRLERTDPSDPRYAALARDLWSLGMTRTDAAADRALEAAGQAATSLGQLQAAEVARRELDRRRRDPLVPNPLDVR